MDERSLAKLALLAAALGIAGLFGVSQLVLAEPMPLAAITLADAGRAVRACGDVSAVRERNGNWFLTLESGGAKLPLVIFSSSAVALQKQGISLRAVERGMRLCAAATVSEYPAGSVELVYRRGAFSVGP